MKRKILVMSMITMMVLCSCGKKNHEDDLIEGKSESWKVTTSIKLRSEFLFRDIYFCKA